MNSKKICLTFLSIIALTSPLKAEVEESNFFLNEKVALKETIDKKKTEELIANPFGLKLYKKIDPKNLSQKKHCDVLRHLKVPATPRRLDTYMRPEFILARKNNDQLLSAISNNDSRQKVYESGIDLYGCYALDSAADLDSNLSSDKRIAGEGPHQYWQANSQLILGLDIFSRFVSDDWTGGQLHFSFTWPEALNSGPLYSYGNTLNPAGLGTRQYHGYFYTDVGRSRDVNTDMQGPRVFEYWFQQGWGKNNGLNYWRIGATNPWITFNKSIVSGLHGFWAFNEPGIIGTTPSTANGPLITTAPMGISLAREVGNNLHLKGMIMNGYYDPSGGLDNKRGLEQYWDLDEYGLEIIYEATYRGGTYSQDKTNFEKPWFVRLGGQLHTGHSLSNTFTKDGEYFFPTAENPEGYPNDEREKLWGNSQYYFMAEKMIYREAGSYNRGLTSWFKAKYSPWERRGSTTKGLYGGLAYEGIGKRDKDILYLGYAHMLVNEGVLERSRNQSLCTEVVGCEVSDFQGAWEIGYNAQIKPYLFITPKIYYVVNPNVRKDLGNILTAGVEFRLSY